MSKQLTNSPDSELLKLYRFSMVVITLLSVLRAMQIIQHAQIIIRNYDNEGRNERCLCVRLAATLTEQSYVSLPGNCKIIAV
ncbi:UNVERIFIED_CONTAM: hypothetical protein FKN15_072404 [Acipenser sinensis]